MSVELSKAEPPVVFDLGTGSRILGEALAGTAAFPHAGRGGTAGPSYLLSCLVTHLHFDHLQGLPFFLPAITSGVHLDLYAPAQDGPSLEKALDGFIRPPYFPVGLDGLGAELEFHELGDGSVLELRGGARVTARQVPHRGPTLGYRLEAAGLAIAYLSDHQAPSAGSGAVGEAALELADGVDLLIHDAQYTPAEFAAKSYWGHSTPGYALEVAKAAGAKRLALFHHDPTHSDDKLDQLGEEAASLAGSLLDVLVAADGLALRLG